MLFATQLHQADVVAFLHGRKYVIRIIGLGVVHALW